MNSVAIVVLNWNGIADTLECLDSLQKQTYKNYTILVVDNGSTDSSRQLLDKYHSKHKNVKIIYNPKNYGFAGGVNTGIRWAMKEKYDYVALFNNDATADKDWLTNLVQAGGKKDIGISTGLLLHKDGKTIDSTGDWYSIWGLPFPRNRNDKASLAPEGGLVFCASGGASLYKIEMLRQIGLFDDDFFAYYEDTDISFRAQLAGWKITYTNKAVAYHKQGETSKRIPGFTVYQTFKNLPLLFIKNVPRGLLLTIGLRFYFAYMLMFLNAIKNGNYKPAFKGAWQGFLLSFKKIKERHDIQKNKRVSTEYIRNLAWKDLPPDQTGIRKLRKYFIGK